MDSSGQKLKAVNTGLELPVRVVVLIHGGRAKIILPMNRILFCLTGQFLQNLIVASNGKLRYVLTNKEGTNTFSWFVSTPINNYGISIHVAPYDTIQYKYTSVTGEEIPVTIWVLPESHGKSQRTLS